MELEAYCALCGVPFDIYADLYRERGITEDDVAWTKYFIALRKAKYADDPSNLTWFLSGVGKNDGSEGFEGVIPSLNYDARLDIQPPDASPFSATGRAYTNHGVDEEIVYPMHPACWHIFLQVHALFAPRNPLSPNLERLGNIFARSDLEERGRGLVPDWAGDYAGPEQFWDDGWTWNEDIDTSIVANLLEEKPEWDFLVSNPDTSIPLHQLMQNPPIISSTTLTPIPIHSSVDAHDVFSRLPEELLLEIIRFLPTTSVQNARLASRVIASVRLGTNFWRSRFAYPNELCHVRLPAESPQVYQLRNLAVDWREVCYRLLHLEDSQQPDWWKNRRRIVSLNSKLVQMMLSEDSQWENIDSVNDLVCRYSFSCCGQSIANSTSGLIPTFTPLTISITFRRGKKTRFLSGMAFTNHDSNLELGFHEHLHAESTTIKDSEYLMGFVVALTAEGIVGINVVIRKKDGMRREKGFGDLENVGKGLLFPVNGSSVRGLTISVAKNRRVVAIGLLEKKDTISRLDRDSLKQSLWYPDLPPRDSMATTAIGPVLTMDAFSYRCLATFGDKVEVAEHLVQIDVYMDMDSLVHGFKYHFNDRESTPGQWIPGKAIPCLIDGPGGERINGMEVIWLGTGGVAGLNILTNRRSINATTANVLRGDLHIEQHHIKNEDTVIGIFGETEFKDGRSGPYRNFGLLYVSDQQNSDTESSRSTVNEDQREFDDHMNVKISRFPSAPTVRIGEPIGTQPNHGFTCSLDLRKEIKSITACLGSRSPGFDESFNDLVGVKVVYRHNSPLPALLGRCTVFGPTLDLPESDCVVKIEIGLIKENPWTEPQTVSHIIFTTRQGMVKGFRDDKVIDSSNSEDHQIVFKSDECLELIGLAWQFDLRQSLATDHGIQPLYMIDQKPEGSHTNSTNIQKVLYPSHPWMHSIPSSIRPQPIPAKEGNYYPFTVLILHSSFSISSIRVFFNNFLQGLSFTLSNNETHSVGNLLGSYQDFSIEQNERICSIYFYQSHQTTIRTQLPGDVLSVEGICFGLCRWIDGEAHIRHSPYLGPQRPFGPFINQQRGLWNADWGGSAAWAGCFPRKRTSITVQPGTSFAGMYLEFSSTHVRRAGALVSDQHGLPEDVEYPSSRQLIKTPDLAVKESLSDEIDRSIPYLGAPPPAFYIVLPTSGRTEGIYRIWCPAPSALCKIITYRHRTWGETVVIGLEFISRDGSNTSTLLGHRSVWMEHAVQTDVGEGEEVERFEVEGQHEAGRGVEGVKIIIGNENLDKGFDGSERTGRVVGFYAYVGEFIEGIGVLKDDA